MPAWPQRSRVQFDRAYHCAIAGGTVYFGNSADGKVYALDAASGAARWSFFTGGPVRFAPTVWRDRVFVASDDGYLYCLAARDGRLVWRLHGGPQQDWLLGNQRMISRWPVRGGPVVADGVLYFAAGIWPTEETYVYAVKPSSGEVIWCNDSSGTLELDHPHSRARAKSGVAAQGYLAVHGDTLLVSTGRAVPGAFDRAGGTFRYCHYQDNMYIGGSDVVALDGYFVNGGWLFAVENGARLHELGPQLAIHPGLVVFARERVLTALDRRKLLVEKQTTDRKGDSKTVKTLGEPVWTVELPDRAAALIIAGDKVVVGTQGRVLIVDVNSGKLVGSGEVDGVAHGLAVAGGRLYVSTDRGTIHCFDGDTKTAATIVEGKPHVDPVAEDPLFAAAAEEIVRRTGVREGYCLDLGCGDGRLALALAKRTDLQIHAVECDALKVQAARRMLEAAGLYGVRVTVHHADPADAPCPNYFADLIVSGRSVSGEPTDAFRQVIERAQRPAGGVACLGKPEAMATSTRGELAGIGRWTHQYTNPANTLCSSDQRIRGPLAMLWFRDTDLLMPDRHGRGPAPLVCRGRMFVEGVDALRAVSIYNGRTLWEVPLEGVLRAYHQEHILGTAGTGSNFCVGPDRVYVHTGDRCLGLDVKSGKKVAQYQAPPQPDGKPGTWGYIAYVDGTLFGSLANREYIVKYCWRKPCDMSRLLTESLLLFALDAETGKVRWTYRPEHSIRHNAIAIGNGRVHLIDRPLAVVDDARFDPATPTTRRTNQSPPKVEHPPGRVVTLDAATGKTLWQAEEDVFGTVLALSEQHDVLLMSYQPTNEFKLNSDPGGRMAAFRATRGERIWNIEADYISRPILNDRTIYAEPGAWDLLTGRPLAFELKRWHGCGILAGSRNLLVFRSATLGYVDLTSDQGIQNYGGIRPGCWVNAIPAGGLVLMADGASWCRCSYLHQATIALQPE